MNLMATQGESEDGRLETGVYRRLWRGSRRKFQVEVLGSVEPKVHVAVLWRRIVDRQVCTSIEEVDGAINGVFKLRVYSRGRP